MYHSTNKNRYCLTNFTQTPTGRYDARETGDKTRVRSCKGEREMCISTLVAAAATSQGPRELLDPLDHGLE